MQMSDSREIKASPKAVWAAILNPEVLKDCIPGCTEISGSAAEGFEATVTQKIGPVKATFKGAVTLSDMVEGKTVRLAGEGKGGPAGFAKGAATVNLDAIPGGTKLTYAVDASVGGKLAQLGSRIIDGVAKKMADEFFTRFQHSVEGPAEENAPEVEEAVAEPAVAGEGEKKKGWLKRLFG